MKSATEELIKVLNQYPMDAKVTVETPVGDDDFAVADDCDGNVIIVAIPPKK